MLDTEVVETNNVTEAPAEAAVVDGKEVPAKVETKAEAKKEAAKKVKQLKLKVNQKEIVEDLPFELEEAHAEWMGKQLQKSKAFDSKAAEYSQLEKDVVEFMNLLRENPRKALANPEFGIDIKKLAAQVIEEEIAAAQKTPEELEKERLKAELEEIKSTRKKEAEAAQKREQELLEAKAVKDYDEQVTKVLKDNNLPKNKYTMNKMALYMMDALDNQINATPEDIVHLVKKDVIDDWKEMIGNLPDEQIESFIGEDIFEKVRKKNIAKVKQNKPAVTAQSSKPKEQNKVKIPYKQFFKGV